MKPIVQENMPATSHPYEIETSPLYGDGLEQGWIRLWRKSMDSQVFLNPGLWQFWCYLLLRANHEPKWVPFRTGRGETQIFVKPGQTIFGRRTAARDLRCSPDTVRHRLKKLENMGNLTTQSERHYTLVTIRNWNIYQDYEISISIRGLPTNYPPKTTNKNYKNEKIIPPQPPRGDVVDILPFRGNKRQRKKKGRQVQIHPEASRLRELLVKGIKQGIENWKQPCTDRAIDVELTYLLKDPAIKSGEPEKIIEHVLEDRWQRSGFRGWLNVVAGSNNPGRTIHKKARTIWNQMQKAKTYTFSDAIRDDPRNFDNQKENDNGNGGWRPTEEQKTLLWTADGMADRIKRLTPMVTPDSPYTAQLLNTTKSELKEHLRAMRKAGIPEEEIQKIATA
jgi:hypothetical protein